MQSFITSSFRILCTAVIINSTAVSVFAFCWRYKFFQNVYILLQMSVLIYVLWIPLHNSNNKQVLQVIYLAQYHIRSI
jgi:hypothetical protein